MNYFMCRKIFMGQVFQVLWEHIKNCDKGGEDLRGMLKNLFWKALKFAVNGRVLKDIYVQSFTLAMLTQKYNRET